MARWQKRLSWDIVAAANNRGATKGGSVEFRRLGGSGLKVSEVGLGCNNFGGRVDAAGTREVVAAALAAGVNFFDTADVYGKTRSEQLLGAALKGQRPDVVIATKFGMPTGEQLHQRGGSRRYILQAVEGSLQRLATDYIDLYQMHLPDAETPIDETLRALDDLVTQGKVRYIGCSNYSGWQIADADWCARTAGRTRFVTAQNAYSLLDRNIETEVIPACERFGLSLLPYFPLGSGMLTGKYKRGEPPPPDSRLANVGKRARAALNDRNFDLVEGLTTFAQVSGHSLLELAFGWLLTRPLVGSVIAGATTPAQVEANVAAGRAWRLTFPELVQLNEVLSA
jgi:aryl-alcohol dehydrogenase-like predicted oxidoreductase